MAGTIESPRKVFVSNLVGCESTSSEGMRVINYLKLNGHTILEEPEDAEYVVINTCAFVDVQRRKMTELLADVTAKAPAAKLIIMGCAREIAPETLEAYNIELLCGHYDLDKLDSLFFTRVKFREAERFSQHSSLNKTVIIASRGCVGHCTYCSIKRSTGNVKSQPIQAVLDDIRDATAKGLREFFISGDDLGSYGLDIHTNLPSLLREIVALDLDIKVLLGNINPRWVNEYIDDLVWFFQQDVADKWIFIPIQSGNNEVLSSMGRTYTIEACEESIRRLQSIEGMKLYYDLIVGFPTETDDAFMDTLNFVLNFPPSHVTVTSFSREAGTPAYDLEPLAKDVLHDRQKRLVMVYTAAQNILSRQDPTLVREFGT